MEKKSNSQIKADWNKRGHILFAFQIYNALPSLNIDRQINYRLTEVAKYLGLHFHPQFGDGNLPTEAHQEMARAWETIAACRREAEKIGLPAAMLEYYERIARSLEVVFQNDQLPAEQWMGVPHFIPYLQQQLFSDPANQQRFAMRCPLEEAQEEGKPAIDGLIEGLYQAADTFWESFYPAAKLEQEFARKIALISTLRGKTEPADQQVFQQAVQRLTAMLADVRENPAKFSRYFPCDQEREMLLAHYQSCIDDPSVHLAPYTRTLTNRYFEWAQSAPQQSIETAMI